MGLYPRDAALELGGGETPRQPASRASSDIGGQDVIQSVGWISEEEVVGVALEGLADGLLGGVVEVVGTEAGSQGRGR